jgi:hypothetical protein
LSFSKFAQEFGGMHRGRYGWEAGTLEEQIKAANKLKEWLINWGVYIQRTKKDVRGDVPENIITEEDVKVNQDQLYKRARERMQHYKNPALPVSAMIAMRAELAEAKAPDTVTKAAQQFTKGKKVGVFTMFRPSSFTLIQGLQQALDVSGGGSVGAITGGMSQKKKDAVIKAIKDPNSDMRAVVITITAGGTGLDFPNVTDKVYVNDFDWTPKSAEQSEGRFLRIISDFDVNTIYQIAKGTPDEEFYDRVKNKRKVAETVQSLTQKQMGMIMKGVRRNDKSRREIEAKLAEAIKQQAALEEGEKAFISRQSKEIRKQMGGGTTSASWYGKVKSANALC